MRILQLHSDWIEYEPVKKEIKDAEDAEKKASKLEDVLVLFTCVESGDTEKIGKSAVEDTKKFLDNLKANRVLIYPYAHLSGNLAQPKVALDVMKSMEKHAKSLGIETFRAPFGWCKRFSISVKGHPLAEQSREISGGSEPAKKSRVVVNKERTLEQKKAAMFRQAKMTDEKLSENDHRVIGQKMDLYSFHEAAPGMPFFHNNGMVVLNELLKFWRDEHDKAGYQEIRTPMILNKELWEISGHWEKYSENMYFTKIDDQDFAVKPMNCPGGMLVFKTKIVSYRDLPMRVAELGTVHRHELSGVLSGLFRVRVFTQDDAHIYMRPDQINSEIEGVMEIIDRMYKSFGLEYKMELSTRPEKSIGTDEQWKLTEDGLKKALESRKAKYKLNPGDGAFYGPKIDFHVKDSMGRYWQCGTIQLDMTMPENFDLNYVGEDNKHHRVVMLHRTVYGSLERFLGMLVEHFKGKFPVWLSPVQAVVISIGEKNNRYAEKVRDNLKAAGVRAEADLSDNKMGYKIREAQMKNVPYMIIVGENEEKDGKISVRTRKGEQINGLDLEEFLERILCEIKERKLE